MELHKDLCKALCGRKVPDSEFLNEAIRSLLRAVDHNRDDYWFYDPSSVAYHAENSSFFYNQCIVLLSVGKMDTRWTKRVNAGHRLSLELMKYGMRMADRECEIACRIKETKQWDKRHDYKRSRYEYGAPDLREPDLGGFCDILSPSEDDGDDSE